MSRFQLPENRIVSATQAQAGYTESVQSGTIRDLTPRFLGEDGPSLVPPKVDNILDATLSRVARGSQEQAGGFQLATQSIAEWVSDIGRAVDRIRFPAAVVDDMVFTPSGPVPVAEADVGTLFDSADDFTKAILADRGLTREKVIQLTENDPSNLNRWYSETVYRIRTDQGLKAYAENHSKSYLAAGVGAVGLNLIDPVTVATLGTGAALSTASRAALRGGARSLVERAGMAAAARSAEKVGQALGRGSFSEAVSAMSTPVRHAESLRLLLPATAAEGAGFAYMAQLSAREADIRYGLIEEEMPFEIDYVGLGLGGLFGMAMGSLAYRSGGVLESKLTPREYMMHNGDTMANKHVAARVERGDLDLDELMDPELLMDLEGVERRATDLFHTELYRDHDQDFVREVMETMDEPGGVSSKALNEFMGNMPSPSEFRAWVDDPFRSGKDTTAVSRAFSDLLETQEAHRQAVADGNEKEAKRLLRKEGTLRADYESVKREFTMRPEGIDDETAEDLLFTPVLHVAAPERNRMGRASVLLKRLDIKDTALNTPSSWVHHKLGLVGDAMSPTRKLKAAGRSPENDLDTRIAALTSLVIEESTSVALRGTTGVSGRARSFKGAYRKVDIMAGRVQSAVDEGLHKMYGTRRASEDQKREFGRLVYEWNQAGPDLKKTFPEEVQKAGQWQRDYYDKMAEKGILSGYLPNKQDNYVPIQLRAEADNFQMAKLAGMWRDWMYAKYFDPEKADAGLNIQALQDISEDAYRDALQKMDIDPDAVDPGSLRLKLSDLPEEYLPEYKHRLKGSILREAMKSVDKRQGKASDLVRDPLSRDVDTPAGSFMDARGQRAMDQEFWMQQEVLDLGVVETDLSEVIRFYDRSTGYNIARQESLKDAFGEVVRFDDLLTTLRNDKDLTTRQRILVDELEHLERANAKRVDIKGKNMVPRLLSGVGRGTINMGVGGSIASTEVEGALAAQLFNPADLVDNVRVLAKTISSMDKATQREMGFGYQARRDYHRMFGDERDRDLIANAGGFAGRIGKAVLAYEDASRYIGLEAPTTQLALSLRFNKAYASFYFKRKSLDKLSAIRTDLDYNSKEFRASVREGGLGSRVDVARDMAENGLLDPEMLAMAKRFNEINPDSLAFIKDTHSAMLEMDPSEYKAAEEFIDRLRSYASNYAEQYVTTADASTTLRADQDWFNLFTQFMSFPQAWFGKTLARTAESPAHTQIGYLGLYAIGEMQASIIRDIAYGGHSPETVVEKWENDPMGEMTKIISRMPWMGPWNQVGNILLAPLQDDPAPTMQPGAASASLVIRGAEALRAAGTDLLNGDPIRPSAQRSAARLIPGWNQWALRVGLGIATEADADR